MISIARSALAGEPLLDWLCGRSAERDERAIVSAVQIAHYDSSPAVFDARARRGARIQRRHINALPQLNRWRIVDSYAEPAALVASGVRLEIVVALEKKWKNLDELARKQ